MSYGELSDLLKRFLPLIEEELRSALRSPHPLLREYYGMMQYHMGWRDAALDETQAPAGKRIRPLLCLLACQAAGGDPLQALPAAAAIEILHNFSLVHDDIEDNSDTRRHRPTVWKLWGQPQAINVGDGMFALAFLTLGRLTCVGVVPERAMRAMQAFQETCLTLTEGQFLDMSFEDRFEVEQDDYLWMIRDKTATLLATAARIGAIVAGANTELITALREYGDNLGMAFQIEDDLLGIWGDETETGKPTASDVRQRKKSLPIVYAIRRFKEIGDTGALSRLQTIYQLNEISPQEIAEVLAILESIEARTYCEQLAAQYHEKALAHLAEARRLPAADANGITALQEFAELLVGRRY